MGEPTIAKATLRTLVTATQKAFRAVWPTLRVAGAEASTEQSFQWIAADLMLLLGERAASQVGLPAQALARSRVAALTTPMSALTPLELSAHRRGTRRLFDAVWPKDDSTRSREHWVEAIGAVHESLLALPAGATSEANHGAASRKRSGSYYTPAKLAGEVVRAAFANRSFDSPERVRELRVLDPAVGAGVFLTQSCLFLAERLRECAPEVGDSEALNHVARHCLFGVDLNPLSVAVTELCLWLLVAAPGDTPREYGAHLLQGDSLLGPSLDGQTQPLGERLEELEADAGRLHALDWRAAFAEVDVGFDVVLGNPPWVAYAGRSAQPLPPALREHYARHYAAWKGFPTLHGLFVERSATLAPRGSVALLLPSPVADLDGYRWVRAALTRTHRVRSALTEFGQDAFNGVTQPCFALVADAAPDAAASGERWTLSERQRAGATAERLEVPPVLELLRHARPWASDHFGEMGFQTTRAASQTLLLRAEAARAPFELPLLEGRNVREFRQDDPRLFLRADSALLKQAKCRLRSAAEYQRVEFVVRQTASVPIAALHNGLCFRNSLLGGFGSARLSAPLLVALLNSSLYRALHLAGQRDARQAAFPQVKLSHLRALPDPPHDAEIWQALERLTQALSAGGEAQTLRADLDALTFELFRIPPDHQASVLAFLKARAPRYAPAGIETRAAPAQSLEPVRRVLGLDGRVVV